jgi:hypothetical protein
LEPVAGRVPAPLDGAAVVAGAAVVGAAVVGAAVVGAAVVGAAVVGAAVVEGGGGAWTVRVTEPIRAVPATFEPVTFVLITKDPAAEADASTVKVTLPDLGAGPLVQRHGASVESAATTQSSGGTPDTNGANVTVPVAPAAGVMVVMTCVPGPTSTVSLTLTLMVVDPPGEMVDCPGVTEPDGAALAGDAASRAIAEPMRAVVARVRSFIWGSFLRSRWPWSG